MKWSTLCLTSVVASALACSSAEQTVTGDPVDARCTDARRVLLVPLDAWGRALNATVSGDVESASEGLIGFMSAGDTASLTVEAGDLLPASVEVQWTGEDGADGLTATVTGDGLVAVNFTQAEYLAVGSTSTCNTYRVFVGLEHPFYATSGPAPKPNNEVTLLIDGEDYWESVYNAIVDAPANARIHQTTWWWQSDFEFLRPEGHHTMNADERREFTALRLLESHPGAKRLMVARFAEGRAPGLAYLNTDPELRAYGADPDDGFELMLQGNPVASPLSGVYDAPTPEVSFVDRVRDTYAFGDYAGDGIETTAAALESLEAASYHQKAIMIGDDVAFISGMNVKSTDWDTSAHHIFDERRMEFESTAEQRLAVLKREALPDRGPRKDYGVKIVGPAASDLDVVLSKRWSAGIASGAMFEGDHSPFDAAVPVDASPGTTTLQVVATMPPPHEEQSIFESQARSVRQAQELIYIEDQYFRAPMLDVLIAERMAENPDLHLIVVTKPVTIADGGKKWTVAAHETFSQFPDRYILLTYKAFDREGDEVYLQDIDIHSKMHIVDDVYLSTGSCNKNNRGFLYEGELNVAVNDPAFVAPAREAIFANVVGPERAAELADASGAEIFAIFKELSEQNAAFETALESGDDGESRPQGFIYPLELTPDYLLEVGPDVF